MHLHDCDQRNANCYKHAESEICLNTGVKEVLPLISKSRELRRTELLPSVSEAIVQMALTKKREACIVFNWACFYWYVYIYIFFFASLLPQCVLGVCWTTMLKVCHRGTIWIRQWHWTTITTVGCLLLSPQHIGLTSGCCKFITPNTLAIPPNRVKS